MHLRRVRRNFFAGVVLLLFPIFAFAVPVKWTLNNVTFEDGGVASGYFVYDVENGQFGTLGDFAISVSGGNLASFPAIVYSSANASSVDLANVNNHFYIAVEINGGTHRQFRLETTPGLGNALGISTIVASQTSSSSLECYNCGPFRRVTQGTLTGTYITPLFQITSAISGNWYNPDQPGHGLQIEVLPGGVVTVFWFVFDLNGNPVWINGVGTIEHDRVSFNMSHFIGGRFPPAFDSNTLNPQFWGTLKLVFTDCDTVRVSWSISEPGFGQPIGDLVMKRLTHIAGLTCQ